MSAKKSSDQFRAVVHAVVEGKHGPYAIAEPEGLGHCPPGMEGSVTFTLLDGVWEEDRWPEAGDYVLLSQIHQKRGGWRATKVRFYRPSDILQSE